MAKKSKPEQGALFEEKTEPEWLVITTEDGVHELRHTSTGKLAHEKATSPIGLTRLRQLADSHNELKLMPRAKVECAADIGGSVDAALRQQTKTAERIQAQKEKWRAEFLRRCRDAEIKEPTLEVVESWRVGGLSVAKAFAAYLEHFEPTNP